MCRYWVGSCAPAGTAAAESCLDRVLGIASRHGVTTDPPTAGPLDPDVTAQDLARSGGVIEPKRLDNGMAIAPPRGQNYGMETLPDVEKHDFPGSDLTALQAVLVAARAGGAGQRSWMLGDACQDQHDH